MYIQLIIHGIVDQRFTNKKTISAATPRQKIVNFQ